MAKFNEMQMTTAGKSLYAKTIAGEPLEVVRVVLGDGGARATDTTEDVISPIQEASFTVDITSKVGVAIIKLSVSNENFEDDVEVSEIGVYCKDPDTQEVKCYSYAYASDGGDIIPAASNGEVVWKMQLHVYIENATSTSASQSERLTFTPTVAATAGLSIVVAECEYVRKGSLVTAFFKITGTLAGESVLTVFTPIKASFYAPLCVRATVDGTVVSASGIIEQNTAMAIISNIGAGDFVLYFSAQYLA